MPQDSLSSRESLSGLVERVTFHSDETGFCVLRVKVKRHKELVTVIGSTPSVSPGEYIQSSGVWKNDREHGVQFKADFLKSLPPNTLEGMEKYLGSGLIKGIGPHFAKKLISAFGEDVFDIIEGSPARLMEIPGVGKKRSETICRNWGEQKIIRDIMVFLQSHGVGTTRATRIYKTYGDDAIRIVSENPYRLAKDIRGIGFISADTIARNIGIDHQSLIRARAGLHHILFEETSQGHCGLPEDALLSSASELLEIPHDIVQLALSEELLSEEVVRDTIQEQPCIFMAPYYVYEKKIAERLHALSVGSLPWGEINTIEAIPWCAKKTSIILAENQQRAVEQALISKVMVITGGPGTGKTTIINSILTILRAKEVNITLCAPTGRAAKRLSESTHCEATTIHRLLEIDPAHGGFKRDEEYPLETECLIIDESSMVDVQLFYSLLRAIPVNAVFLIVGDVDQLPSVGAGKVLSDIIDSSVVPVVRLEQIFRQSKKSDIIVNAHKINQGIIPVLASRGDPTDFYFIASEPEYVMEKVVTIIRDRLPTAFGLDPIRDVQVLCPMRRGGVGSQAMNMALQDALNPYASEGVEKYGQCYAVGDKVMQVVNDYEKDVYNGDIGFITAHHRDDAILVIDFDGRSVEYDYTDLDQLTLAYATTIHKSQGSEYPAVLLPLTMQSFMMLKRNLVYTGVTRGKRLVILVGQKKALVMAVKNYKGMERYSKLKEWLVSDVSHIDQANSF